MSTLITFGTALILFGLSPLLTAVMYYIKTVNNQL